MARFAESALWETKTSKNLARLRYPLEQEKVSMTPFVAERRAEIEALCRRYGVLRLELFGSTAAGQDRPGESDLDLLVEFEPHPLGGYADAYFGLREALEELSGRNVDLVVASAVKNPYFRQSIERTKALLYAA